MNEDNKKPSMPEGGKSEAEKLREELENLRGTFQKQLDETTKELEHHPVIQELEYGEEMIEEEEDTEVIDDKSERKVSKNKTKKKRKVGKIIAITIPVVLLVIIVGSLLAYVIASMTNPNFSSFVSSYVQASSAETYEDKIAYLEKAVSFCPDSDSAIQTAMKQIVLEEIVVATYNEKGYADAYSYLNKNMTEDMIEKPVSKEFKKIVKIKDEINTFALSAFEKVFANVGDAKEVPATDVLSNGLAIPSDIKDTAEAVLKTIAEGLIYNRSAENIHDSLTTVSSFYSSSYNALVSFGADGDTLAENVACVLYDNGLVLESAAFSYLFVNPEKTDISEKYASVKEEIAEYSSLKINVIELAETALAEEKTSDADVLALVKASLNVDGNKADIITALVNETVVALKAEADHNIAAASEAYSAVLSVHSVLGINTDSSYLRICRLLITSGDLSSLQTVFSSYFTDEGIAAFSDKEKAFYDETKAMLDSFARVYNVYYEKMSVATEDLTFETLKDALNAVITEESPDYEKGFVNYFIYGAAQDLGDDINVMPYLENMEEYLPEMPLFYGGFIIDEYISNKNYTAAAEYAQKLLTFDVSYEYANYIVAMRERISGDLDAAIEAALKGIEIADSKVGCGIEAAIAYMLKGDFETAFNYILIAYNSNSPSMDLYDLILIYDNLYEGDNEEIKTELGNMVSVVNQTYAYSGISSYNDTKAIINGEKTLEDVFMSGNYMLSNDE